MIDKTIDRSLKWVDDRLGVAKGGRTFLDKIFPDHWSFMLGEIALYSFVVLLATGVFLSLYYVPSAHEIVYHGSYIPLRGQRVSEAYSTSVGLSFDVRSGLLMRQAHHWAADIFLGSIAVHMARVFFTGAFRKPREFNWIVGVTMLILGIVNGFLGYSLPDDLVSGTGIRIAYSIIESIPLVGSYLAFFVFGGNYPGNGVILERFYILHVLIVPLILIGLLSAHLGLLVKQKHTQFKGKGKTEHNVVGSPMFPTFMAKTTGFLFMTTAVIFLLGGFAQINPIWQFGQYEPYQISYAVQPDWYMGWLDGALRIMPSWEWVGLGAHHPAGGLPPRRHLPRSHLQYPADLALHRVEAHQGPGVPQPARPTPGPSHANGRRGGHAHPAGHDLLRLVHRRHGQLLRSAAQVGPVVLPVRRGHRADHRLLRDRQDLQRDAGGRGHRQAQAGRHRLPVGQRRVHDRRVRRPGPVTVSRSSRPFPVPTFIDLVPPELATGEGVRRVMR